MPLGGPLAPNTKLILARKFVRQPTFHAFVTERELHHRRSVAARPAMDNVKTYRASICAAGQTIFRPNHRCCVVRARATAPATRLRATLSQTSAGRQVRRLAELNMAPVDELLEQRLALK